MNKLLIDFLPLAFFFLAYKFANIYVATAVAIATSLLMVMWSLARRRPVEKMQWINLVIIGFFGGATLFFHDETFIKWKPTVLYFMFACILIIWQFGFKKNLLQSMLGQQLDLPQKIWAKVNLYWASFFCFLAILNIVVAHLVSTEVWVNFKVFGLLGIMLVFVIGQSFYLQSLQTTPTENDLISKNTETKTLSSIDKSS